MSRTAVTEFIGTAAPEDTAGPCLACNDLLGAVGLEARALDDAVEAEALLYSSALDSGELVDRHIGVLGVLPAQ